MMLTLMCAALFLAYANGANDNFKGVASLFGSATTTYRTAIWWATLTTFAGSMCSILLAQALLARFSGQGLVSEELAGAAMFLAAVALGAGATVIAATTAGLPVSTTHALTGALLGSGVVGAGSGIDVRSLGGGFLLPLLLGPLLAVVVASSLYLACRDARRRLGIGKEWCVCVGESPVMELPVGDPAVAAAHRTAIAAIGVSTGDHPACIERYAGSVLGIRLQAAVDAAHLASAGVVSFARGLNDTPKLAALLLTLQPIDRGGGAVAIGAAIAAGGLLSSRRVARTMSCRITTLSHGQGLAANLSTGALVILASVAGLPVSTTHVSVGSLAGIGFVTGTADRRVLGGIGLAWLVTVPLAAALGAVAFAVLRHV